MARRAQFPTIAQMKIYTLSIDGDKVFINGEHDMFRYDSGVTVFDEVINYEAVGIGTGAYVREFDTLNKLSHYPDFATALSIMSGNGELYIDVSETLAVSSYAVSEGITLIGASGVLSVPTGGTLIIKGQVRSGVKLFDHVDQLNRGVIDIVQSRVNIRWFGALNILESGTNATDNKDAIDSTYIAGRNINAAQAGGILYIPGPSGFDTKKIDLNLLIGGGQRNIIGDGQRNSLLRVAVGENTGLLDASGSSPLFNGSIQGVSFSGLRDFNTTADPVVYVNNYNFKISDCHITNGSSNGLEVAGAGQVRLEQIDSEFHNGWGFYIHGSAAFTMDNCGTDQCDTGGLLIEYDEVRSIDRNKYDSKIIHNFYAEATPIGIKLAGVGNVLIDGMMVSENNTREIIRIANFTDSGGVVRNSQGNVVHIRGAIGDNQKIVIEKGCTQNIIFMPPHESLKIVIEDANDPGLNKIIPFGGQMAGVRDLPPVTEKNHANLIQDTYIPTRPLALESVSGTETESFVDSFGIHPASAHDVTEGRPVCLSWVDSAPVPPVNNTVRIQNTTSTVAGKYWVNILVWADYEIFVRIQLQRVGGDVLDWVTGTFLPFSGAGSQYTVRIEGGKPQWVSIPFTLPSTETLFICDLLFHTAYNGNRIRCQYFAVVDQPDAGLIYQDNTGVIQGANDHFESTVANLPPANEVPIGTKIWNLDTNKPTWSDGTNWVDWLSKQVNITNTDSPYQASVNDWIIADPTAGAVTIFTPLGAKSSDRFHVKKSSPLGANGVTIDALTSASQVESLLSRKLQDTAIMLQGGEAREYDYDGANWLLQSVAMEGPYTEIWTATPIVSVPSGGATMLWTFSPLYTGQVSTLFSYVSGVFTANFDMGTDINLDVLWRFIMSANNQDAQGNIIELATGTGLRLFVPVFSSFTHTRTGTFRDSKPTRGFWKPNIGDTMQFTISSDAGQNGQTDLEEALLVFTVD